MQGTTGDRGRRGRGGAAGGRGRRTRLCLWSIGCLLWLAAWPGHAFAGPAPGSRVLVLPFTVEVDPAAANPAGSGAPYWLGEASAILLQEDLQAIGVGALPRRARASAFSRLDLPMSGTLTRAMMIRVGELLGASEIIVGRIGLADRLTVHATVIRLDSDTELPETSDQAGLEDLFALFERLAHAVGVQLQCPLTAPATQPHPTIEAFESYVKGLVAATPAAQERFLLGALALAPGYDRAQIALWSVQSAEGAPDKALATARRVASSSPFYRQARFDAALSLIDLQQYDEAFLLLTALDADRSSPVLANALGVVQLRRTPIVGMTPASVYFKRAVDQDPSNADYLFNLGYADALAGDADGALGWLRQAVRVESANGATHLVLSAVLASAGQTVEAQRELDLATLLGGPQAGAAKTPGGRVPRGLERLRTDLDVSPAERAQDALPDPTQQDQADQAAFYLQQGKTLLAQERDHEAIDQLKRAVYLSPYADEPHVLLGRLYLRDGRLQAAIDELKVAIWCRESVEARLALGEALLANDQKPEAQAEARRALVLQPDSTAAADLLKRAGGGTDRVLP